MSNSDEVKRLADAIAGLATAITDMITANVRTASSATVAIAPPPVPAVLPDDPWMNKRQVAVHFKVSVRSVEQ